MVFDRLQKEGQPVLIFIHADWCPTCRAQDPIVSSLLKQDEFQRLKALKVDFDRQKNVVKAFKAVMQGTLIVCNGGKKVGRSTGDTSKYGIAALLRKAL